MVAKSDKEKVKTLLSETIRLLCKNGLHFKSEFCVEALVGITLDQDEEFFLSIKETVKSELVSSTKESVPHRKSKSERRSKEYVVKGEPSLSSCHRKRPTNANTSDNEDLGELALGEMHEGEQQFWTSVTEEGDGDEGGGVPVKKRHIQIPDESSSSNQQIVVKGEPDSDSDIEEVASTSQEDNQPMNLLPGSFSFPGPSTSGQSFMGNIPHSALPQQVWDQLPPFSTLPGTSGIPSAPSTVTSPDGHQQIPGAGPRRHPEATVVSTKGNDTRMTPVTETLLRMGPWLQELTSSLPSQMSASQRTPLIYTPSPGSRGHHVKHECPTCHTPCVNKGSLLRHMKIHLETPEFKCPVCGHSYYEKWRLARHMRSKEHYPQPVYGRSGDRGPGGLELLALAPTNHT